VKVRFDESNFTKGGNRGYVAMSEYMFGVGHRKPPRKKVSAIEKVAKRHGCYFVEVNLPGTGYQNWFAGPNRGCPFDENMERRVMHDLETAGLLEELD
jgi:hypothetical protein